MSNREEVLRVREEEWPFLPDKYQTAATRLPLELSTASTARITGRLAEMFREEVCHQSGSDEEKDGSEAHMDLKMKADSSPGVN